MVGDKSVLSAGSTVHAESFQRHAEQARRCTVTSSRLEDRWWRSYQADIKGFCLDSSIKEEKGRPESSVNTGQQRQVGEQDGRVLQMHRH